MADTTLRFRYPTGATLYTQIEAPDGTVYNGTSFVAFTVASWATFATSTPETPSSSGRYVCQFPTSSAPGLYTWATYKQAGASPASTDVCVGSGSGYWNGVTFGAAALDHTQAIPTSNTAQTVGDALNAARAQGFGPWSINGTTLTLYAGDGTTVVRTFTLNSATNPTART